MVAWRRFGVRNRARGSAAGPTLSRMGTDSMLAGINLNLGGTHYAILDQGAHALAWQPPGQGVDHG